MTNRQRLYPEIKRLREQEGLMWREIGDRLGLSLKTVHDYYSDPDGLAKWARQHRKACLDCGAPINTANPGKGCPIERCTPCHNRNIHEASRLRIIERMQAWAERFGDPPMGADWQRTPLRRAHCPAAALRQDEAADEEWPATTTVLNTFGSWNAAIEAAGFTPLRPGQKRLSSDVMREAA